jgi:hypothetical protein
MTGRYLISTRAVEDECRCGSVILAGFDEGAFVKVDPTPLDPTGELAALLDGRRTFALIAHELVHRHPGRIRAGLIGAGLRAEHRCVVYSQPTLIGAA